MVKLMRSGDASFWGGAFRLKLVSVLLVWGMVLILALPAHAAEETAVSGTDSKTVHAPVPAEAEAVDKPNRKTFDALSKESATCVSCHIEDNRGLYQQWGNSKHYGANVGCYECHRAEQGDPDAFMHKKFLISVLVTPKDCGRCHQRETKEFEHSVHSKAGDIETSGSFQMAKMTQGMPDDSMLAAGLHGCIQCHGSRVTVKSSGKLDATTWPNSGIGRINPDGSRGTCTSCHQRHEFSREQARRPEACGKCHRGPAHPQKEIYDESKHGINFYANVGRMNLQSPKWVPGEDFDTGPTCATCHMSATVESPLTHDVSHRVSWNLKAPVSFKAGEGPDKNGASWKENRKRMEEVCTSCHTGSIVQNFYQQFDNVVSLYNNKFAKPAQELMDSLKHAGLRSPAIYDDPIEWTWFEIWHQAGRRVRQGASMQAPDFVQWQGFHEIGRLFYTQFLPQAEEMVAKARKDGKATQADEVAKVMQGILSRPEHAWYHSGKKPDQADKVAP
ncbi:MAG: cytochrome c3 family protein [Magnetococcales bacterium]|nr:cytochrome c3 family protein [Magnetococcales bacterium]